MSNKELEKAVKNMIEDKFDQIVVAIRASHPNALDIKKLSDKLDEHIVTHERDNKSINEKLDPMYVAFSTVGKVRGAVMWISATVIAVWGGVEAWKKIIGK